MTLGIATVIGGAAAWNAQEASHPPHVEPSAARAAEERTAAEATGLLIYFMALRDAQVEAWFAWAYWQEIQRLATAYEAARGAEARAAAAARRPGPSVRPGIGAVGECTGFRLPDYIIDRESSGNPNAIGPRQSDGSYPVGCSQTLTSHYRQDGTCEGLDYHTVDGQRECTRRLRAESGTDPWAATR